MTLNRAAQSDEVLEKRSRLTHLMNERDLETIVLSRRHNFSWATGGADNHVRHASDLGVASLVFYRDGRKVAFTSNIEAQRIMTEELEGLGFELRETPWYAPQERSEALRDLLGSSRAASDDGTPGTEDIEPHLPWLRMKLTDHELKKYRWLGKAAGRGVAEVCRKIRKGVTEEEIAGCLFAAMQKQSVKPTVLLVAADDRLLKYRHPIPTQAKVKRAVMVVLCARRWGLICSVTRLVHFGKLSPELKRKHEAVAYVDAVFIDRSRPGTPFVGVLEQARKAYAERGFADEWKLHHQGGPTGYLEREFTVNPETPRDQCVETNMALAWNPSIAGTKSEDTVLVTAKGPEVITASPGWPALKVALDGKAFQRPDWLIKH